jgi:hypothetical protein
MTEADPPEPVTGVECGARRSVYEDRDPVALAGDPNEPEAGWRRIGEIDPDTGLWRDGPRWIDPRRTWW